MGETTPAGPAAPAGGVGFGVGEEVGFGVGFGVGRTVGLGVGRTVGRGVGVGRRLSRTGGGDRGRACARAEAGRWARRGAVDRRKASTGRPVHRAGVGNSHQRGGNLAGGQGRLTHARVDEAAVGGLAGAQVRQDVVRPLRPGRALRILAGGDERLQHDRIGVGIGWGSVRRREEEATVGELLGVQVGQAGRGLGRVTAGGVQRHQRDRRVVGIPVPRRLLGRVVRPAAVGALQGSEVVRRVGRHRGPGRHQAENRQRLAERGPVSVRAGVGVVQRRESAEQVATREGRRISAGRDDRQNRLARLRRVARRGVGRRGQEAQRGGRARAAFESGRIVARGRRPDDEVGRLADRVVDRAVGQLGRPEVPESGGCPFRIGGLRCRGRGSRSQAQRGGEEGRQYRAGDEGSSHCSSGGIARLPEGPRRRRPPTDPRRWVTCAVRSGLLACGS